MPTRMIRDWTTSEKIDQLSEGAEVLFTRLIMKADDHGCFHGSPKILAAFLFPLKTVEVGPIIGWLRECAGVGLIQRYEIRQKQYVKIIDFGQRLRSMKSKFPQPVSDLPTVDGQLTDKCPLELEDEYEVEENPKENPHTPQTAFLSLRINAAKVLNKRYEAGDERGIQGAGQDIDFIFDQFKGNEQATHDQILAMVKVKQLDGTSIPTKPETILENLRQTDWVASLAKKSNGANQDLERINGTKPQTDHVGTNAPGALD